MIATKLMGGLGNQMFQYAAGRRLAEHHKTKLYIDKDWLEEHQNITAPRKYELGCFKLNSSFMDRSKVLLKNEPTSGGFMGRRIGQFFKPELSMCVEKDFSFDKDILYLPDNSYLDGYWQSQKYFLDIRDTLLEDFSFELAPTGKNKSILQAIKSCNSISVHVRRGDYASDKKTGSFHGLMGLEYYKKAIAVIAKDIKAPCFFVFSDDPQWCKENLIFDYPITYIDHNKDGSEDMRLMINCKHNIIANSSFSWWGAWLNQSKGKKVLAPKRWFADASVNTADIIPDNWIKV